MESTRVNSAADDAYVESPAGSSPQVIRGQSQVRTVGYFCPYLPEELVLAAGLRPVRLPFSATPGAGPSQAADAYCYVNPCEIESESGHRVVLRLELPPAHDDFDVAPPAVAIFKHGLQTFHRQLEELAARRVTEGDVRRASALCREMREGLRALYEYPREDASPVRWRELYEFARAGFQKDRASFLQEIQALQSTLARRMAEGVNPDPRPRLMLAGDAAGADDRGFLALVEQAGGNIVTDAVCTGSLLLRKRTPVFGLREDPLDALVEQYLYSAPAACRDNLPRRLNYILKTVRDFKVHGLIYYSLKQPVDAQEHFKAIKGALYKELLVPTLLIEAESYRADPEGVQSRVEAFIGIVGGLA